MARKGAEFVAIAVILAIAAIAYNLINMQKSGQLTQTNFFASSNGPGLEDLALGAAILLVAAFVMMG